MAFVISGGAVVTYAEALDVRDKDQRLFESNEIDFTDVPDNPGSLNNYIEDLTIKATARINEKIRQSARWREYLGFAGGGYDSINNIPAFKGINIKARQSDFTDMCCYYTLKEYLLPKVADFGNPESSEVQKIQYYDDKFNDLFRELTNVFDYYDGDEDGTLEDSEKMVRFSLTRRTRGRRSVTRVR
jgi:hypothetical protein